MEAKKKFIINVAYYGIILVVIGLLYKVVIPILMPFIIGFCVASFINFVVYKTKPRSPKIHKCLAILFTIIFYLVIGGLVVAATVKLISELVDFARDIPNLFQTQLMPLFVIISEYAEKILVPIDEELASLINDIATRFVAKISDFLVDYSQAAVRFVANGIVGIPGLLVAVILTLVSTFYFTADYTRITGFVVSKIPEKKRNYFVNVYRYGKKAIAAFLKTYFALFLLTYSELCIGFMILGIPYAALLGFTIAIFDILPVLGVGGVLLPWAVIQGIMGNYKMAIGLLILYIIITVVRNTLESKIVGEQIGLHPLATLIVMILGLKLIGLVGLILFPITLVAIVNMKRISGEAKKVDAEKQK